MQLPKPPRIVCCLTAALVIHCLHVSYAGNSNCQAGAGTGTGCSCQPVSCSVQDGNDYCLRFKDCDESGCVEFGENAGTFHTIEQQNATECASNGPLVGGGCTNAGESFCKKLRTCTCGPFGNCEFGQEEEAGLYSVCEAL